MSEKSLSIKDECIFVSLSSYAHDIITKNDVNAFNGEAMYMANCIKRHFDKKIKRYNKSKMERILNYLKNVSGPAFPDKINASVIMVASLHYLLGEGNHKESKLVFSHFKFKVKNIIENLEKSEHRDELYKAYDTIVKMLDEKPSEFKSDSIKLKQKLNYQYFILDMLEDVLFNITETEKNKNILNKIKVLYKSLDYKSCEYYQNDNRFILKEYNHYEIYNLYFLNSILNIIKKFVNKDLPILKFNKINFNYLITDVKQKEISKELLIKIIGNKDYNEIFFKG